MSVGRAPPQIRDRIVGLRRVRADKLLPNPKNWRRHPKAQGEALKGLLQEIGYADALLARETPDGLMLIDGHLRAETTPKTKVPVLVLDLDEAEADKLLLTLDPLAAMAEMDGAATQALLEGVQTESDGVRAMLAGLQDEAQRLLGPEEGLTDPDDVPEDVEPVAKRGDVWVCGDHRVMCGDSTDESDVARLMAGERAGMVFTDPPWNVQVASRIGTVGISSGQAREEGHSGIENDSMAPDEFAAFLGAAAGMLASLVSGDIYCVMGSGEWPTIDKALRDAGFHWSATIVWVKAQQVLTRRKIHTRYEPIWYGWPQHSKSSWMGSRTEDDVWEIKGRRRSEEHPTMKPVELVERAITNSSKAAGLVLDPFLGSGTTMMAAERLGRRCFGMEIEPRYVDVAVRRWEEFTGRKAEILHETEAVTA